MTPPPYVLSQGVLVAIGNALSHAFAVGIGTSHEANKPHHEARPRVPSVRQRSKAQRPSEGHARTIVRANRVCVSSLANVPILSSHGTLQFLGCLIVCPMMRRLWFGVDDGLLRPLQLERGMPMEYMLVRTSL